MTAHFPTGFPEIYQPTWPKTGNIHCCFTGRVAEEDLREGPGHRLVIAEKTLQQSIGVQQPVLWLNQTHSTIGINADQIDLDPQAGQVVNFNGNLFTHQGL